MSGMLQVVFQLTAKAISHCVSLLSPCVKWISTCEVSMAELLVLESTIDERSCIRAPLSSFVSSPDLYFCMWQSYSALQWFPEMDPSQFLVLFLVVGYFLCWFASFFFFSYITFSCVILNSSSALFLSREINLHFLSLQKYFPSSLPHWYGKRGSLTPSWSSTASAPILYHWQQPAAAILGKKLSWNQQWNKTGLQRTVLPCPPLPHCFLWTVQYPTVMIQGCPYV